MFVSFCLNGQGYKIGVRAGVNYSKLQGPLQEAEDFSFSSGIHFGINYTYYPIKDLGFRGEVLYIQRGSKQNYNGDGFHLIRLPNGTKLYEEGTSVMNLDNTLAYFSIPLTVQYQVNRRFEVFGGLSVDFLVGPSGRGKVDFESSSRPEEIFFVQSYDFRYGSDPARGANFNIQPVSIIVDGDKIDVPKIVGAYYQFDELDGKKFNAFNMNVIGGVNYFLNTGYYIGARFEYGLFDVTNDRMDISLEGVTEENEFIYRDDVDRQIGFNVSFGFRF